MKKAIEIISYWEELKKLIERENIHADFEINEVDMFIRQFAVSELVTGNLPQYKWIHPKDKLIN